MLHAWFLCLLKRLFANGTSVRLRTIYTLAVSWFTQLKRANFYLLLLCLLAIIMYLDRVCMSVAGPRMQDALRISPEQWGWVGTVFSFGYGIFEIPTGHWGDRFGARRILTRIVLWWSAFTVLTGAVSTYPLLLGVRFLFGAGEAGAFPIVAVAISQWFPPAARGRAFGFFIMCSQLGGALSPLLVVPIQQRFGWHMSFYLFGCLGVLWSAVWFWRFRDRVSEKTERPALLAPWRPILLNRSLWAIMALTASYVYSISFYQIWLHTYLVKGRAFSEHDLSLSALPYFFGAAGNLLGGFAVDWLVPRASVKWSRRGVGMAGLLLAAISLACTILAASHLALIACLSLAYAGITFQQPAVFAACADIGGLRGGAVTAMMNTAGQVGFALSSFIFGYFVKTFGNYDAPLVPMALLAAVGMLLWAKVDVTGTHPRNVPSLCTQNAES
jgi:ACS family glucarate transporter-like MFS transporter